MEITRHDSVKKKLQKRNYSIENIFGNHFEIKRSAFHFRSCSSEEVKSADATADPVQDVRLKSYSTLNLLGDGAKITSSAWKGVVYFQKINARALFSEDYRCRIGKKRNEFDWILNNIFDTNDDKYSNLIVEAKKKQSCGPCLTKKKCDCGDANILISKLARTSIQSKFLKTMKNNPYSQVSYEIEKSIGKNIKAYKNKFNKVGHNEIESSKIHDREQGDVLKHDDNFRFSNRKRRDSIFLTKRKTIIKSESFTIDDFSKNKDNLKHLRETHVGSKELDTGITDENSTIIPLLVNENGERQSLEENKKRVTLSIDEAEIIPKFILTETEPERIFEEPGPILTQPEAILTKPEPMATKTPRITVRSKTRIRRNQVACTCSKYKSHERLCKACSTSEKDVLIHHKLMFDVASSTLPKCLKEMGTNTISVTIYSESTQTCTGVGTKSAHHKCPIFRTVALDPINRTNRVEFDKTKILVILNNLMEELDEQYKREANNYKIKKKKHCICNSTGTQTMLEKRRVNCTYAYSSMAKQYMQYATILSSNKISAKCNNDEENSPEYSRRKLHTHQNQKLLKFLAAKRIQFNCVGHNLKKNLNFTHEDTQRFEKEFHCFFVQNKTRVLFDFQS